jgi:hypothetical protein
MDLGVKLLTAEAYPATFAPFPPIVPDAPDYTECTNDDERATVKAMHTIDKKTRADIVTMNTALADVFFKALSLQVRASFLQRRLCKPNIVFVNLFVWFVDYYRKTTAEDCKAHCQRMAADWHPTDSFDTLLLCLFTGAAFAGFTNFMMADHNIVNIGLRIIKQCSMYAKEYKAWIACEAIQPRIVETSDSFKKFWAAKITLVNQTTVPASQYGYGIATTNNDDSIISYGEIILNFGAPYAATQESVKLQGTMIAVMQSQLNAMSQYCMALEQQATPANHAAQQQRGASNNQHGSAQRNRNGGGSRGGGGYQQPAYPQPGAMGQCTDYTPTPYKHFKNWNYSHTHDGDIKNGHTSRTCAKSGPAHNPHATRTNMMNALPVGLHKTILPSASGRVPHVPRQQRPPVPATWQQPPPPVNFTTPMPQMMPPAPYHQMHYMGQQCRPLPSQLAHPAPPAPAPPAGMIMMPYYAPYPQPHPF